MPLDFSSKAEPVGGGVLDFSAKAVPVQKKTREQVQADVAQAQMRRDVMSPPEEMSGMEKVAEAAYWPIRALSAQDFFPAVEHTVATGLNESLNLSARLSGRPEYPPEQLPYQAGRPIIPIPSAHDPEVAPVDRALLKFVEGLTTPGNVAMLPVAGVEGAVGNIVKGMFVPPMTLGAVQQGQVALDPSVPTGDRQEAAVSALLSGAMATGLGRGMVPKENLGPIPVVPKDNGIIVPEVVGPKETPIAPVGRQLNAPYIDAEVLGPKQLPLVSESMLEMIRNPEPIDRTFGGTPVKPPGYILPREQRPVRITPPPEETVVKAEPKEVAFQNETQPLAELSMAKSDYQQYLDVQKKIGALVEKGDFESAEFRQLWQENENIKNRHGGMPPAKDSIGGGIKSAIDKNTESGSVINPFKEIVDRIKAREREKRGDVFALSGPRIILDPKESGFQDLTKKVDGQQLWNRLKNKLTPTEREIYEKSGVDKRLVEMGKVSPEEAAELLVDSGPEMKVESYGMEGKVSEAKREYDEITHQLETDLTQTQHRNLIFDVQETGGDLAKLKEKGWDEKTALQGVRKVELDKQVKKERNESPRATSAYSQVSALDTTQPMPEWTKTKSGRNVQRVDVVAPNATKSRMISDGEGGKAELRDNLWQPDNLHENLPNTLGWAMIQYKDGPKGERIALVAEAQSRWGQEVRETAKQEAEFRKANPNYSGVSAETQGHPLLKDYNRLILKATIDQARKEGATHIMLSDAETAMMTELLDSPNNINKWVEFPYSKDLEISLKGQYRSADIKRNAEKLEVRPVTGEQLEYIHKKFGGELKSKLEREAGFRANYDTILPKIAEELTGSKGERVSVGEHKNVYKRPEQAGISQAELDASNEALRTGQPRKKFLRENLIFKNPDGTPKTDVSGTLFPIPKSENKFSVFEKDRPEQVQGRLYLNPIGPIVKQTVKDVGVVGGKVKDVTADFIRAYAEPLQEQIGRVGGVVSKKVSEEAGQIISRGKELYGELTPVVDVAKKQVGKAYRGGTGWMREKVNVTPDAAQNNFFAANESGLVVPMEARRGMRLAADANLRIGQMAQRANPGFTARGELQRIMTPEGYDYIVKGGEGREAWIRGQAVLNGVPEQQVRTFFDKMKEAFSDPNATAASLDSINQDFKRKFPKTITHVKTPTGWHEVIVSDPFNYLEQAAQRTAHATAFREVYPLIQHNGKWVQSGKLQATRKAVMKELKDGSEIAKFDNLIKALQGHPLDTFSGGVSTTAKSIGGTIAGPMKALMLSGNFATNLGEVVSGGPSIFLGYKSVSQGLAEMVKDPSFYEQLELTGARNKTIYNNAFDSSAPVRSVSRQVGNVIRNVTGQQFLNEVQEGMAAASAKVYADRVKSGTMSQYDSNRAHALFRAMGFNKEQATAMVGGDATLLKQFENRAASWLTTGNQAPAEMSRLGASRLFNSVFWFHKYPQMTLNQFRSVGGNLIDDAKAYVKAPSSQTWSPLYHNAVLMGRQLGGRSVQGAITIAILAGVSGGIYGLVQTKREAEEDVMKFVGEGIVSGYGGPLSVMKRLGQNVKGGDSFVKEIASLSAPASVTSEMIDMGMGVGKYQGLNTPEKVGKFLEGKTPASRMMKTGMAVAGMSEKDLEFETAVKGFYKWRREQSGQTKTSVVGGTDEQIEMRAGMQKVKKAIEAGEDWVAELRKVKDLKGAGNALRAGTLLQVNGKALNESQLEALKRRIGANGLEKIQARDAMIREVGRELNEKQESGERKTAEMVEQPTGNLAVDRETEGQRNERVTNRLSPKVRDYLKQNEMENLGYTPAIPRGIKKQQLTVEEARKMEEEYVKVVDQLVGTLIDNVELKKANLKVRQEVIGKMLESSRKVASAKTLGLLEEGKNQR